MIAVASFDCGVLPLTSIQSPRHKRNRSPVLGEYRRNCVIQRITLYFKWNIVSDGTEADLRKSRFDVFKEFEGIF